MSVTRVIPASYVLVAEYVRSLLTKTEGKADEDLPFSAANRAKLNVDGPKFLLEMNESSVALQNQMAATVVFLEADIKLDLFISAFFQVFDLGIRLGKFKAADLAYYKKAANDSTVPDVRSDADTERWTINIIDGEKARIAAGGTPMPFPLVADIAAQYAIWKANQKAQSDLKEMAKKEGRDVADMMKGMVALVMDIHDEINFTNRKLSAAAQRDISREYGMQYYTPPGDAFEITVSVAASSSLAISESVLTATSKVTFTLLTNVSAPATVQACRKLTGCADGGTNLVFNTPITIPYADLAGEDSNAVVSNGSDEAVEVKVRIEG